MSLIKLLIPDNRVGGVAIHGVEYRRGSIVRVKTSQPDVLPFLYAQIKEVYVYNHHKVFLTQEVVIVTPDEHLRAVQISVTERNCMRHYNELFCHGVLHPIRRGLNLYIIESNYWSKDTLFY